MVINESTAYKRDYKKIIINKHMIKEKEKIENIGFDVKGVKGETRSGLLNDRFHWIEYQNRNGEKGWLNGKAKYFAFETFNSWIIVSKNRIKSLLYDKVDYSKIVRFNPKVYQVYMRPTAKDLIIKVPTSDLMLFATKIISK